MGLSRNVHDVLSQQVEANFSNIDPIYQDLSTFQLYHPHHCLYERILVRALVTQDSNSHTCLNFETHMMKSRVILWFWLNFDIWDPLCTPPPQTEGRPYSVLSKLEHSSSTYQEIQCSCRLYIHTYCKILVCIVKNTKSPAMLITRYFTYSCILTLSNGGPNFFLWKQGGD